MKTTTYYAASAGCGLSGEAGVTCKFSRHNPPNEATKRMQAMLVAAGASQVKIDGYWGPCTESAYQKIFGEPLSKESLAKLGITCSSFVKEADGTCTDGSDTVTPIGGGGQPATPTSMQSLLHLSPSKAAAPTFSKVSPTLVSSVYRKPITVASATSSSEQTIIPGVPNLYVTLGGLAVLGVVGWFGYKAMTKPVKRNGRRRVHRNGKIIASSFQRYNGGVRIKRLYGSSTVTRFYVFREEDRNDASKWLVVEGFGPTPGDRKTDAIRRSGLL